jgi:hypothetical protein
MVHLALHTELKCQHIDAEKKCSSDICGFRFSHGLVVNIFFLIKLSSLKSQIEYGVMLLMLLADDTL